ncbi:MAG: cytochrome c3 family protein [Thiogranum sp.]|nr:cytochrome c3 family protein [Thiogranum sp.]
MSDSGRGGRKTLWLVWLGSALLAALALAYILLNGENQTLFMPGPLSPGHHQLAAACDACHTDPLGGGDVLQEACLACHGDDRKKPVDSHPLVKFSDPRNADRLAQIEATRCVTCHTEHRPEITATDGLTQPLDLCVHCHRDIAADRPSHAGMRFDTCKDSGCHNYHNNRALYTDFLLKHQHAPELLEQPLLPARQFATLLDEFVEYPHDRYPVVALALEDADAPQPVDEEVKHDWLTTAHAAAGVNCSACHLAANAESETPLWTDHPGQQGCSQCHALEVERFGRGRHGMRLATGLAPMTPEQSLLPMQPQASHRELTCNSCHPAHRFDTATAAVDACLDCHADAHSLAYKASRHHELWQRELKGELSEGSGVSCAGCHMPRIDFDVSDWLSRIMVDHNQSANLSPNSKMIRNSCLHCHGLPFSLDALADRDLIDRNFRGRPQAQVRSIGMAGDDQRRALEKTGGSP